MIIPLKTINYSGLKHKVSCVASVPLLQIKIDCKTPHVAFDSALQVGIPMSQELARNQRLKQSSKSLLQIRKCKNAVSKRRKKRNSDVKFIYLQRHRKKVFFHHSFTTCQDRRGVYICMYVLNLVVYECDCIFFDGNTWSSEGKRDEGNCS